MKDVRPLAGSGVGLPALDRRTVDAVTSDVFDTLLIRKPVSERSRQWAAATQFAKRLRERTGTGVSIKAAYESRRTVQKLAFRTLGVAGAGGEVRLEDLCAMQAEILQLDVAVAAPMLVECELDIERNCLYPNNELLALYKTLCADEIPIYLLSDTTLSKSSLAGLISEFCGSDWIAEIFSSADVQKTKREGSLYRHVLHRYNLDPARVRHFGDDALADGVMASRHGLTPRLAARSRLHRARTKIDGGLRTVRVEHVDKSTDGGAIPASRVIADQYSFGAEVIGPILSEFCLKLWAYLSGASRNDDCVALFCARGGLTMRRAYCTFLDRFGLKAPCEAHDFMVSRFVMAKAALHRHSLAAIEELVREYRGSRLGAVAEAFGGAGVPDDWDRPLTSEVFAAFLNDPVSTQFRAGLGEHAEVFHDYIERLSGGATRLVMVDTGLFGSTQRLAEDAFPSLSVESVMLARCNYKGFDTPHFKKTTGLLSEDDTYNPLSTPSVMNRYWQIIEETFEPDLASVTTLMRRDGQIASNLEESGWRERIDDHPHPIFRGAMTYIQSLTGADYARLAHASQAAWRRFRRVVLFPTRAEAEILDVKPRSVDFGRAAKVSDKSGAGAGRVRRIRQALWKSAAVRRSMPVSAPLGFAALETFYFAKWLRTTVGKR